MNSPILIALLVGAGAGAGAGIVAANLSAAPTQPVQGPAAGSADLTTQVASLREQNRELLDRLEKLERAPLVQAPSERVAVGEPSMAQEVAELRALVEGLASANPEAVASQGAVSSAYIDTVRQAIDVIEDEERAERDQRREEMMVERREERLNDLAVELDLAPYQVDGLRNIWTDESALRGEIFDRDSELSWDERREAMGTLRDETDAKIADLLSAEQFEKYQESNGGGRDFGGFGGGGFGGGGFGGGGRGGRGGF